MLIIKPDLGKKIADGEMAVQVDGRVYFFRHSKVFPPCPEGCDSMDDRLCNLCVKLSFQDGDYDESPYRDIYVKRVLRADSDKIINIERDTIIV